MTGSESLDVQTNVILLRHANDSRESFAKKWEHHGTLVSQLPLIRTYLQNHVVEQFAPFGAIEADGIVELRFDRPEDMASAFASSSAAAVKADEVGFLGHGTGYALENDTLPLDSPQGAKLIVIFPIHSDTDRVDSVLRSARSTEAFRAAARDEVATVIARPEMDRAPQQVSTFIHLLFADVRTASNAGQVLAERIGSNRIASPSIVRVRTNLLIGGPQ